MDELVRWLSACLDEDERIAWDACGPDNLWKVAEQASCECCSNVRTAKDALVCTPDDRDAPHIAEWSPARVLREIDAKRRLIKLIFLYEAKIDGEWGCCHSAEQIEAGRCEEVQPGDVEALRLLALPYADREGYRPEWAPAE